MAAGSAGGGVAIPMPGDPDDIPSMRATMETMVDSITTLHNQMAVLMEDPGLFNTRPLDSLDRPIESTDEVGPAIRERTYSRRVEADRIRMQYLEEALNQSNMKVDDLERTLALYFSEMTADRDKMETMNEALISLRSDMSSSRSTIPGERLLSRDRQIVTAMRGSIS